MPVDDGISNPTANRPFHDVLNVSISRRKMMIGSLATAATTFFVAPNIADAAKGGQRGPNPPKRPSPLVGFTPAANDIVANPNPSIAADYDHQVLIPWGTSLFPGVADLIATEAGVAANTSGDQAQQVGIGHDGMWFFADNGSNERGVLCINHEFGTNYHVLRTNDPADLEDVLKSQHAHGVSVIELEKVNGLWQVVIGGDGNRNRRIHVNTPVSFSGPAASSALLDTGSEPLGTVNNCANGYTPWGTYLTCEENFNGYFGGTFTATAEQRRYGFSSTGFGYGWHLFDDRFDLSNPNNDQHRFGWVVEIDPQDPGSTPVKRTALGRFKHESAEIVEGKGGRIVAYMGDDERFDYIYKFVSAKNWKAMRAQGRSPLDEGTLYVARFNDDNTGDWLPLTPDNPALADMTLEEILVFTRLAADKAGATPMDRPEWVTTNPYGDVFCALTNNSRRTEANAANPLVPNPFGHIIRWRDSQNHTGTTFEWDIFFLAEDSHGDDTYRFGSPDGLWADDEGRLFIQTDGDQPGGINNQMVVADTLATPPVFKRLFAGVAGDEITGLAVTPDGETMFINSQHPGDGDPTVTNFPVADRGGPQVPRDATIVITKIGGGTIGS
ncbi:MAG: PhoX family protein [Acidobacteriota bacterium]